MENKRSIGHRIRNRLYYKYSNWVLNARSALLPESFKKRKNIFIYFDYEREFGGFKSNISDLFISELLAVLDSYNLKTTWFTVGKIFELYPDSINSLLQNGHELASHSYSHSILQKMSREELNIDFSNFSSCNPKYHIVRGFHSPQGRWNPDMYRVLHNMGYHYDLAFEKSKRKGLPFFVGPKNRSILRLHTAGDDWPLYVDNYSELEIYQYFVSIINNIQPGHISGIGFHPWILNSNDRIYEGFKQFIEYLRTQNNVEILRATDYSQEIIRINY
jgi:peptidoglycan/xylan/chitin deacetylase (PgdA/CDA1 family)